MAESLADKLKRLAAEKKAAKEAVAVAESVVTAAVASVANDQPVTAVAGSEQNGGLSSNQHSNTNNTADAVVGNPEVQSKETVSSVVDSVALESTGSSSDSVVLELASTVNLSGPHQTILQPTPSSHPLAMQFAEMETALLTADPTFKTILRDVHRTLGKDPELVTQMTEEEISLVVRGLVVFANAEIVEPAKAKAVKAGQAALKKKAISADDL